MNGPYHIEVERDGCRFCGAGKTYWVVGSDDVADGTTYENEEDALDLADMLNDAFENGLNAAKTVANNP